MRIVVLGAGVVGATTAALLARQGHEVVVVDRRDGCGLETSFANGGQISASHAEPWANPATMLKALKWLGRKDAPLYFPWWRLDPELWRWLVRFLLNCRSAKAAHNLRHTLALALYSRAALATIRADLAPAYDARQSGILHFYRDEAEFERARATAAVMADLGLPREVLTPAACLAREPALKHVAPSLAGGLYSPKDESGDAHLFTREMARIAAEHGADFRYGVTVRGLEIVGGRVRAATTDRGRIDGDWFVLALGCQSTRLAATVGLSLPIYPAKGYSVTLPLAPDLPSDAAPTVSLTDDENKLVVSRLGDRLRIAGTAELSGWSDALPGNREFVVRDKARALFPDAGNFAEARLWAGLRPVTPDGLPILGRAPLDGLILNTGHGTLGWTMACGSARIVGDLIAGRSPEIDIAAFSPERF